MTSPQVNKSIVSADAVLSDWDGHIALLEQPALSSICNGNLSNRNGHGRPEEPCNGYSKIKIQIESDSDSGGDHDKDEEEESINSMSLKSDDHDADDDNNNEENDSDGPRCSNADYVSLNVQTVTRHVRDAIGITSVLGRNPSTDVLSRPSLSRIGSFYQPLTTGSSMVAVSLTEILVSI